MQNTCRSGRRKAVHSIIPHSQSTLVSCWHLDSTRQSLDPFASYYLLIPETHKRVADSGRHIDYYCISCQVALVEVKRPISELSPQLRASVPLTLVRNTSLTRE